MGAAEIGKGIGTAIQNLGTYSGQAAARANEVSAAAQNAQGNFNQASVDNANSLAADRTLQQYAFNSAQAAAANEFTSSMWDKTAAWNESMWERQAEFNREEAQKNRDWQEQMANTAYQRAVKDMKAAGLNPVLAATQGIAGGIPSGAAATVSASNMSSAQGAQATGSLLQGLSASESSYSGQMESLSGTLGLISAVIGSVSSALGNLGSLGDLGEAMGKAIAQIFTNPKPDTEKSHRYTGDSIRNGVLW